MCFSNCTFYGSLVSADSSATEFNDTWDRASDAANCFFITLFQQKSRTTRKAEPDFPSSSVLCVISASLFEQGLLPVSHARKPTSSSSQRRQNRKTIFYACNIRFCVLTCSRLRGNENKRTNTPRKHPGKDRLHAPNSDGVNKISGFDHDRFDGMQFDWNSHKCRSA